MADHDPMRRLRGHIGQPPGWGGRPQKPVWVSDKRGPLICSRMAYRSGDQHAPVFDVDLPVVAVRQAGGGSGLVLTGLLGISDLRRLRRGVPFLTRHGYVRAEDATVVLAQLTTVMESDVAGKLVLPLRCPARAVPSATPEHRHLYIDMVMSFRESLRLASALGIVDADHIARSRRIGQWQVRLAWRRPSLPEPTTPRRPAQGARAPQAAAAAAPVTRRIPAPRDSDEQPHETSSVRQGVGVAVVTARSGGATIGANGVRRDGDPR